MTTPDEAPKALLFDVFGTCVDWRTSVAQAGADLGERLGLGDVDWVAVADAWRSLYDPQMQTVRSGERPWVTLDVLHRESLDVVLERFGLTGIPAGERDAFALAWHRLDPWPDTVEGLRRLHRRYVTAALSNGNVALGVELARYANLTWDTILGAEVAHAYKPDPEAYRNALTLLGLRADEAVMVAAHNDDLAAANALGLRTAFLARCTEYGPEQTTDREPTGAWTWVARDLVDLADRLGA